MDAIPRPRKVLEFYSGELSNFRLTPDLELPEGWQGHPTPARWIPVKSVEHYFQACKATNREDFFWVLSAPTAAIAKRRGSARGDGGRRIALREDWEQVKVAVMAFACRRKFEKEPFRGVLLETGTRILIEDSPTDFYWGGRDAKGAYTGVNMLGKILMAVRADLARSESASSPASA
jgi:ribA/ribD-fused uncharacterized protein